MDEIKIHVLHTGKVCVSPDLPFGLGYAFGSTLVGMIVDKVGFGAAWIVILGCVVVGYTLLLGSIKKVKEQYAEMEVEI